MTDPARVPTQPLRISVVLDHPAQHFADGFAILSGEPGLEVEVMYWDLREGGYADASFGLDITWDVDLTSTYPHWSPTASSTEGRAHQCLRRLLDRRPDVILCYGWSTPIARLAMATAFGCRVPILFYGDSTWQHSTRPRLRVLRSLVLRRLFNCSTSSALSTGAFNRDFYLLNGMTPDRVHQGVCPVDTRPFLEAARQRASRLSGTLGADEPVSIVFAGKFVDRKAPSHLIEAVALLPETPAWHLTMIGDGALREKLEHLVEESDLGRRVTFSGFKNSSEMPAMLAAADILVIPSTRDMRILVATEAMAAGAVPIVSSATAVWGAGDLVEHGITGLVYPVGDIRALGEALTSLIGDAELQSRLASAAAERALDHDSDDFARFAASAIRAVAPPGRAMARRSMVTSSKLAIARAITRPLVGRAVARVTGNSIAVRGARINTASPLIQDPTRAKLALGLYESAELHFVDEHLRSDLDVVELGSSIGVVGSLVLRRLGPGRRLIAVEADRDLAEVAQENFRANAGSNTWALDVAAISYGPPDDLGFEKGATSTGGRLTRAGAVGDDLIERRTLSQLLTRHGVDRYVLIADIEGAEVGIICDDAVALDSCDQMIIELHDTDTMRVADMRAALVEQHAFKVTAEKGPVLVLERPGR